MGDEWTEASAPNRPTLERLETGILGLDDVLAGGPVRGGVHHVGGRSGTAKTILGNHLAHNLAETGEVEIVATVLTETHARMPAHSAGFRFFDPARVARRVHDASLFDELAESGPGGVLDLLSIVKVRDSDFDASIREFVITDRGLTVPDTFDSAEAVLTGMAGAPPAGLRPPREAAP